MFVKSKVAARELGLHPNTLRKYADNGTIRAMRLPSGQRVYDVESYVQARIGSESVVCYCRVSSRKQADDLKRQEEFMRGKYPGAEVVSDIGSGLNFRRKGLRAILERILRGDKLELVVAHRDRLARFGFELIEFLVGRNAGRIVVLDRTVDSPEAELTRDIVQILHVFSCRIHGMRKYRDEIKADPALPHGVSGEVDAGVDGGKSVLLQ